MKILFLCDEYPPCMHGGIGTVTQSLAREMVNNGHEVFVYGFYPYFRKALQSENDAGVKVFRYHYGNRISLKISRHFILGRILNIKRSFVKYTRILQEIIMENNIDIIEIPDFNEAFRYSGPRMLSFPDFEIPYIVKIHGSYSHLSKKTNNYRYIHRKEQNLFNNASAIISISKYSRQIVKDAFSIDREIRVIHNGISLPNTIRNEKNIIPGTVVFAGSLTKNKGVFALIRAWENVIREKTGSRLLLYGNGNTESLDLLLKDISANARESIIFKGFVSKEILFEMYSVAACAVFPSYTENLSMAPIEAMSVGCPTIFTQLTSGPEIIQNKLDGLLVNPGNESKISDAILHFLEYPEKAAKMGRKGREKVTGKFNILNITRKHLSLYTEIVKKSEPEIK